MLFKKRQKNKEKKVAKTKSSFSFSKRFFISSFLLLFAVAGISFATYFPSGTGGLWNISGNNLFWNSGNVGIGTNFPQAKLDIQGVTGTGTGVSFFSDTTSAGNQPKLRIYGYADNYSTQKYADLYIDTYGRFRITGTNAYFSGIAADSFNTGSNQRNSISNGSHSSLFMGLGEYNAAGDGRNMIIGVKGSSSQVVPAYTTTPTLYIASSDTTTGNSKYLKFYHDQTNGNIETGVGNLILTPASNVGIGTTSPTQKLQVAGYVRGDTGLCIGSDCRTSWPNSSLWTDAGSYIYANNSTSTVITDTGNVGIGTTSPGAKLHVTGGSILNNDNLNVNGDNFIVDTVNKSTSLYAYGVRRSGVTVSGLTIGGGGYFSGNVGIGTTSPAYPLDVAGTINATGELRGITKLSFDRGTNYTIYTNSNGLIFDGGDGTADFLVYDGASYTGQLKMGYNNSAIISTYDTNESLTIRANGSGNIVLMDTGTGNVGVGTTSPTEKLTIDDGNIALENIGADLNSVQNGLKITTVDLAGSTGNAGVYLSAPYGGGTANNGFIRVKRGQSNVYNGMEISSSGDFRILTNSTSEDSNERLRITSSGNVGIGTTSPSQKLQVAGYVRGDTGLCIGADCRIAWPDGADNLGDHTATQNLNLATYQLVGNGGSSGISIASNGNVGIGTSSPAGKLDVAGDIVLASSGGNKQIYTWSGTDSNWRIGMSTTPGFTRSLATSHVQYLTYAGGSTQGFAVGVNGGDSSFEIRGSDHTAFFRGNVGLGTANPYHLLDLGSSTGKKFAVYQNSSGTDFYGLGISSGTLEFYAADSGSENPGMVLKSSGNVGIGTTSPSQKLQVAGYVRGDTGLCIGADCRIAWPDGADNLGDHTATQNLNLATYQLVGNGGSSGISIASNGNVGIGTSSPAGKLDVAGDIVLASSGGNKQIYTWSGTDSNWRIGMSTTPGFTRSLATSHVQYLTYAGGSTQGFAVGVNGGDSSFEIRGSDHTAFFRGNVGLGTANPYHLLDLGSSTGKKFAVYQNSSGTDFYGLGISSGTLEFYAADSGSENPGMVLKSSGNVGIGTTSPSQRLDVTGYVRGSTGLCIGADCRTSWPNSSLWTDAGSYINASNATNVVVTDTGRFGVGTTSPSTNLHVVGTGRFTSGLQVGSQYISDRIYNPSNGILIATDIAVSDNRMIELYIEGNSYSSLGPIDAIVQAYNYTGNGQIIATSAITKGPLSNVDVFHYNGYVYFWLPQTSNYQTYRFRLATHSGAHRITSITNAAKPTSGVTNSVTIVPMKSWYSANDGSGSGLDADLWDGNQFATYLNQPLLTSSSPSFSALTLSGTLSANNGISVDGNTVIDNGAGWHRSYGNTGWYNGTYGGGWYMTDSTWIRSYGSKSIYHNSGILRTDGTFQVGGGGSTLNVVNGGDFAYRTNVLFANTAGNVGIGTTTPSQKLQVAGYVRGDTGLCIGADCRTDWPAGVSAIDNLSDAQKDTTNNNFFLGHNGFSGTFYNEYNTGIGIGSFNNPNVDNTYAFLGDRNTAVGYYSLSNNTTGYQNSAVGAESMFSNTTGKNNAAFGNTSLYSNTSGSNNAAFGDGSLYSNTDGIANTAQGNATMYYNTTGDHNTALGYLSLYHNTTGDSNVALGSNAGTYIADGSTANTVANQSVFLGGNTKAQADNQTNQIVIGYNATGLGSNTVVLGNDSIVTTALKGNVGIGTTSPSAKLDVSGTGKFSAALTLTGQTDDADGNNRSSYWSYDPNVALVMKPAANDGATAILFPSIGNSPSDFAYIVYDEDYGEAGKPAGENGALILGAENDGAGSSDHVRVKSRLVVEADMSSSDPTEAFQVKSGNVSSDLFTVLRSGNVGVGTTSPTQKLQVAGYVRGDTGLCIGADCRIAWPNGADNLGNHTATQNLNLATYQLVGNGGSSGISIASNGNVGIGATSPAVKLQVGTDAGVDNDMRIYSDTAGAYFSFLSRGNYGGIEHYGGKNLMISSEGAGGYMTFFTSGTQNMIITDTGNVGIGTGNPQGKLHISGGDLVLDETLGTGGGNDSYTKLLLHMDGSNGSVAFDDSSASAHSPVAYNGAQIYWGGKFSESGYFDGTDAHIRIPSSPDFALAASDDWTVDFWFNKADTSGVEEIFSKSGGNFRLRFQGGDVIMRLNGCSTDPTFTLNYNANTWYHLAVSKSGNNLRLFLNGTQIGSTYNASCFTGTSEAELVLGVAYWDYTSNDYHGYLDEFRFSKGIARWTSNFTPPASPYAGQVSNSGAIGIGVTNPTYPIQHSSGAHLTGGGVWVNASDKNLKENFENVNSQEILEKVRKLDIKKWNYKVEKDSIKHIGPTAQDFAKIFALGGSETSISTIDPAGISLVSIKALADRVETLFEKIERIFDFVKAFYKKAQVYFDRLESLEKKVQSQEERLKKLEKENQMLLESLKKLEHLQDF